jgi:hypothetical protein
MKKSLAYFLAALFLVSCGNRGTTNTPSTTPQPQGQYGSWTSQQVQTVLASCEGGDTSQQAACLCLIQAISAQYSATDFTNNSNAITQIFIDNGTVAQCNQLSGGN